MKQPLSSVEKARIFGELIAGPRPRPIDPELKAALLADMEPDEKEVALGVLEIVETGGASIEALLADLDRRVDDETPPSGQGGK